MKVRVKNLLMILAVWMLFHASLPARTEKGTVASGDYCLTETFHASCLKNEVIFMRSATYGRMRVGRCVKAEEVDAHKALVGDDPRYLGCSTDVLPILDQKCSGKTDCEIRVYDILDENIQPCFPGLKMYLEASYKCIDIVDDHRSCVVIATKNPNHIIGHSVHQQICGTKLQPWIVNVPFGQKIRISIVEFFDSHPDQAEANRRSCHGTIVEKTENKNATICRGERQREIELYLSTGNQVEIFLNPSEPKNNDGPQKQFLLKLEALGCSDVIPPEDAWLKRSDDAILIGCYSSRQTWRLDCSGGKWTGVLGNCSRDTSIYDSSEEPGLKSPLSNKAQVLALVAIGGFTVAICLTIICTGAVCLRRFYTKIKKAQDYKTLTYDTNAARNQHPSQGILLGAATEFCGDDIQRMSAQQVPTYSVFVGESDSDHLPAAQISFPSAHQ